MQGAVMKTDQEIKQQIKELLYLEIDILCGDINGAAYNSVWEESPDIRKLIENRFDRAKREEFHRANFRVPVPPLS
jgi:hypothetical protein